MAAPVLRRRRRTLARRFNPLTDTSLRAAWMRSGKLNGSATALANGENLATWNDTTGNWNCTVVGGTAPTGATVGSSIVADPNAAGCIGTATGAIPDDLEGTVCCIAQAPSSQVSARDFDAYVAFGLSTATNVWGQCCLRRLAAPSLWLGFAASNAGAGFSAWISTTTQLSVNTWYRFIWVFSGGSAMRMYVNGTLQAMTMDVNTGGPTEGQWLATMTTVNNINLMGRRRSSGYDELDEGQFDHARWYSKALTPANVAILDAYLATVVPA